MSERASRKVFQGLVVKSSVDKMCTVKVSRDVLHTVYKKLVKKNKKYIVHDPENKAADGDWVEIMSCRPISKNKRWRLNSIIKEHITIE